MITSNSDVFFYNKYSNIHNRIVNRQLEQRVDGYAEVIEVTKGQTVNSKKFLVKMCEHKKSIFSVNNTVSRKNIKCEHNLVATEINVRLTKGEI